MVDELILQHSLTDVKHDDDAVVLSGFAGMVSVLPLGGAWALVIVLGLAAHLMCSAATAVCCRRHLRPLLLLFCVALLHAAISFAVGVITPAAFGVLLAWVNPMTFAANNAVLIAMSVTCSLLTMVLCHMAAFIVVAGFQSKLFPDGTYDHHTFQWALLLAISLFYFVLCIAFMAMGLRFAFVLVYPCVLGPTLLGLHYAVTAVTGFIPDPSAKWLRKLEVKFIVCGLLSDWLPFIVMALYPALFMVPSLVLVYHVLAGQLAVYGTHVGAVVVCGSAGLLFTLSYQILLPWMHGGAPVSATAAWFLFGLSKHKKTAPLQQGARFVGVGWTAAVLLLLTVVLLVAACALPAYDTQVGLRYTESHVSDATSNKSYVSVTLNENSQRSHVADTIADGIPSASDCHSALCFGWDAPFDDTCDGVCVPDPPSETLTNPFLTTFEVTADSSNSTHRFVTLRAANLAMPLFWFKYKCPDNTLDVLGVYVNGISVARESDSLRVVYSSADLNTTWHEMRLVLRPGAGQCAAALYSQARLHTVQYAAVTSVMPSWCTFEAGYQPFTTVLRVAF
eukprot:TRINITY_DN1350_c1_g1_i2.p1 TRINITY_DN1350_c1_g1~~TRINITY_DN1350_c1_g1_i2.p1  ORF type:complete len:564 (+),score=105.33 TRINITY_DN1350_c1_g1_i2:904-2595(+)